jgi:hypothetical protein
MQPQARRAGSGPDQFALVRAAHIESPIWGVAVKRQAGLLQQKKGPGEW